MSSIADNLRLVMDRIARAASKSGRAPEAVRLVAVSKTVSPERIQEAVNAGVQILGENYLQEAQEKMPKVSGPVCWHFIGHLQSRKAKDVVRDFDLIHSVDSVKLAREIDRRAEALGKTMDILVQVNVSGEESKFGLDPEDIEPFLDQARGLEHVVISGLMTMPPFFDQPDRVRPYFAKLRELSRRAADRNREGNIRLTELSMGMSGDFEAAVEEGATLVRVGTLLFGSRT